MSALLTVVQDARELRDAADKAFREAVVRAYSAHSLREIARYAGMSHAGVRKVLQREESGRK